jgi:hypothetical protein
MTNTDLVTLDVLVARVCTSLETLTDAVCEVRDALRLIQEDLATIAQDTRQTSKYVLMPPEPLEGPSR